MTLQMKLDEARKIGRAEGIKEGRKEGIEIMLRLINILKEQGLMQDIEKVVTDEAYRDMLIKKYNL